MLQLLTSPRASSCFLAFAMASTISSIEMDAPFVAVISMAWRGLPQRCSAKNRAAPGFPLPVASYGRRDSNPRRHALLGSICHPPASIFGPFG